MAVMNGKELFHKAKVLLPSLQVLYMSGCNHDVMSHNSMLAEGVNFIKKPSTITELCIKVREIIEPQFLG